MQDPLGGKRRTVRHDERLAASPDERRMPADATDPSHVVGGQHSDDAGRTQGSFEVDATMRAKACGERTKIGVGLIRQGCVGDVTAAAAEEDIVLDARRSGRAMRLFRFCIHALCRKLFWGRSGPLINENAGR